MCKCFKIASIRSKVLSTFQKALIESMLQLLHKTVLSKIKTLLFAEIFSPVCAMIGQNYQSLLECKQWWIYGVQCKLYPLSTIQLQSQCVNCKKVKTFFFFSFKNMFGGWYNWNLGKNYLYYLDHITDVQ
jgi:hypothetical protein